MVRAQDGEQLLKQSMVELFTRRAYYHSLLIVELFEPSYTRSIIWRFWEAISVVHNGIFTFLSALLCREK
jgi:hypothetical protein